MFTDSLPRFFVWALCAAVGFGAYAQNEPVEVDLSTPAARAATVEKLRTKSEREVAEAEEFARQNNLPIRGFTQDGQYYELMKIDNGEPVYYQTENVNAAISSAADKVRGTSPFNVDGTGVYTGVWDGGSVLSTHQEFGGRVNVQDASTSHYHATHVGGTIGASGVDANAKGMAPNTTIESYDWNSDSTEMAARAAMTSVLSPGTEVYHSNHSYGYISGWRYTNASGVTAWHFYGPLTYGEDDTFGRYDSGAASWDSVAYAASYYLPIKSAGNDRGDGPPSQGETFYYLDGGWQSKAYDSATDPAQDGGALGYDCISGAGVGKNVLTVAAANDAVSAGVRDVPTGTISSFSGFGPADDGRVKPDIAGNGVSLYSTYDGSNTDYATLSGTSMSAPNVTGSASLLIEYYRSLMSNANMLASTLKGLIVHTATDTGNAGPDYIYGWGYMDTEAAANHIKDYADAPQGNTIVESFLDGSNTTRSFQYEWDGVSPLKATLVWTDPAGTPQTGNDDTTPVLVNDLDVRLIAPDTTTTYEPWVLDVANPQNAATTGDNTLDNVEQVYLASPVQAGTYTVEISHKSTLTNSTQEFSLLFSGAVFPGLSGTPLTNLESSGFVGGPFSPTSETYTISNGDASSINWTATKSESWITLSSTSGTLGSGANTDITVSINSNANSLPAGVHTDTVSFNDTTNGTSITRDVVLTVSDFELEYNSTDIPVSIVDLTTITSTITVPDSFSVLDVNVELDITHTYDSDLIATLQSPTGTTVELFNRIGSSGNNFTGTILDDEASTPITSGSAPFAGEYQPSGTLSNFDTENSQGTWTLAISDNASADQGTLNSWSITLEPSSHGPTDTVYVDFSNNWFENGAADSGWSSLAEALAVVDPAGTIIVMGDSGVADSAEIFSGAGEIDQSVTIQAQNGTVTIGGSAVPASFMFTQSDSTAASGDD